MKKQLAAAVASFAIAGAASLASVPTAQAADPYQPAGDTNVTLFKASKELDAGYYQQNPVKPSARKTLKWVAPRAIASVKPAVGNARTQGLLHFRVQRVGGGILKTRRMWYSGYETYQGPKVNLPGRYKATLIFRSAQGANWKSSTVTYYFTY